MSKTICRKALPLFLVFMMLFSIMPMAARAEGPDISIEPTSGAESEGSSSTPNSEVDISTTPNDGSSNNGGSSAPQTEPPSDSQPPEPASDPAPDNSEADAEPESTPEDDEAEPQGADGISVSILGGDNRSRGISVMAAGNLAIHRYEAYRWDFSKGTGTVDMRPWYIMTVGGQLAYCVEPTNPDTTSGGYGTIDYNALSVTQQYAIGYALLYGAQDMSNPPFPHGDADHHLGNHAGLHGSVHLHLHQ